MTQLFERDSGRGFDVEQRQSEVDQLKAQLEGAQWNLDKTTVRAPADGYVTNLALRKGARVANLPLAPVMAFIDTSDTIIGVEIAQIDARYVAAGPAGRSHLQVHAGRGLRRQGRDRAAGGRDRTGAGVRAGRDAQAVQSAPFVVRIRLDDADVRAAPAGRRHRRRRRSSPITSRSTHVIRKVLLRQIAILNYVNPF